MGSVHDLLRLQSHPLIQVAMSCAARQPGGDNENRTEVERFGYD